MTQLTYWRIDGKHTAEESAAIYVGYRLYKINMVDLATALFYCLFPFFGMNYQKSSLANVLYINVLALT